MIPTVQQQEDLSLAYIRAIAARSGLICGTTNRDFGFDLFLRRVETHAGRFLDCGPQLDIQVKSTTRAVVGGAKVVYDLEVRAYELLRQVSPERPCILVLLVLPEDQALWVAQSEDELVLRRCAYWMSFRDLPPTENEATVRIAIPRTNVFSVEEVCRLMQRQGETS